MENNVDSDQLASPDLQCFQKSTYLDPVNMTLLILEAVYQKVDILHYFDFISPNLSKVHWSLLNLKEFRKSLNGYYYKQ